MNFGIIMVLAITNGVLIMIYSSIREVYKELKIGNSLLAKKQRSNYDWQNK